MADETLLTPVGDVELFVVHGEDFSFPIYATPYTVNDLELYLVTSALPLFKNPSDALNAILQGACYSKEENANRYWFLRAVLPTMAKKAPGITPKYYFVWNNQRDVGRLTESTAEFHEEEQVTNEQERFLQYLVNKTALLDMSQARIMWRAITQCGAVWLARDKKPIDFGLFTITPLPYRRNWKERIYEMMQERVFDRVPRAFITAMKKNRPERDRFARDEMGEIFWNTTLMDVDYAKHYCHWHLDLRESAIWKKFAGQVEAEVRHSRGREDYARKIVRQIQKGLPAILDSLTAWVKEIGRPCGAVEQKRMDCGQSIVPLKKPGQLLPATPRFHCIPVVVDDQPRLAGPTQTQNVDKAVTLGLREMHTLQLTNGNMRNGGEKHGEPSNGGVDNTGGLPMQFGSESPNANGAVLDGNDHG